MKEKQIKIPGPDHPISIRRNPARVVVSVAGRVIAETRNALTLREATYPPVEYIPRKDVVYRRLSGIRARTQLLSAYRAEDTSPVLRSFLKLMWQMLRIDRARAQERLSEAMGHAGCEHGRSPSAA